MNSLPRPCEIASINSSKKANASSPPPPPHYAIATSLDSANSQTNLNIGPSAALGNQIPQTIFLAKTARQLGAVAASAFGAGFGGSVWALVPPLRRRTLSKPNGSPAIVQAYPIEAQFGGTFVTHAGIAASLV